MTIRKYQIEDRPQLIQLLRLNTPKYFAPEEEQDFKKYLKTSSQNLHVVVEEGKILGCGGFLVFEDEGKGMFSWGLIHPDYQQKGLGSKLSKFRINEMKKNPHIDHIVVRTSQLVYPFYEKLGFTLEKTQKDFWAKGFDLFQLRMEV